ncbi:MAG: CopG family transcriptional regulator [Gemmatimonadota bacterium]
MRTTLDIDDSVLSAVKELARRQGTTAGKVISDLARRALMDPPGGTAQQVRESESRYGFRPFPGGTSPVTNEVVDRLRDELGA